MTKISFLICFPLTCLVLAEARSDANINNIDILSKTTARYKEFVSFTSDIEKKTHLKALDVKKTYSGKLNFVKNKIRLDIEIPSKAVILYDSMQITTVQYPEDKEFDDTIQVIKTKTDSFLNQVLKGNFAKLKVLSVSTKKDIVTYEMIPKKHMSLTKARVSIDKKKHLITQFSYWDSLENKTSFIFKNVVTDKKIDAKLFELTIPENAVTTEL